MSFVDYMVVPFLGKNKTNCKICVKRTERKKTGRSPLLECKGLICEIGALLLKIPEARLPQDLINYDCDGVGEVQ